MTDMRKWIDLVESVEGKWMSDEDVSKRFIPSALQDKWFEVLDRIPESDQLYVAQGWFDEYVANASIVDMRIDPDGESYIWKVRFGDKQ